MKRVLCAIDLSDQSVELVKRAAAIEPVSAGSLTVIHIVPTFDAVEMHRGGWFDPVTVAYAPRREEVLARVRQVVAAAGVATEDISCRVEEGEAAETILEQAQAVRANVIALGTHQTRDPDRMRLGPVAESVLRRSGCDVLTMPPRMSSAAGHLRDSTILCGVDFSPQALHAARETFELAQRQHARVLLVHVVEWLADVDLADDVEFHLSDVRARLVYNAQHRLDALGNESHLKSGVRRRVAIGRPHHELLRVAAEEQASLIVIGKQASRGVSVPFRESTVEEIARSASSPVLTIYSPTHEVREANHVQ